MASTIVCCSQISLASDGRITFVDEIKRRQAEKQQQQPPPRPVRKDLVTTPSIQQDPQAEQTVSPQQTPPPRPPRRHTADSAAMQNDANAVKSMAPPRPARSQTADPKTMQQDAAIVREMKDLDGTMDANKIKFVDVAKEFINVVNTTRDNTLGLANDAAIISGLIIAHTRSDKDLPFNHAALSIYPNFQAPITAQELQKINAVLNLVGKCFDELLAKKNAVYLKIVELTESRGQGIERFSDPRIVLRMLADRIYFHLDIDVKKCPKKRTGFVSKDLVDQLRCLNEQPIDVQYQSLLKLFKALAARDFLDKQQVPDHRRGDDRNFSLWVELFQDSLKPVRLFNELLDMTSSNKSLKDLPKHVNQLRDLLPKEAGDIESRNAANSFEARVSKTTLFMSRFLLPLGKIAVEGKERQSQEEYFSIVDSMFKTITNAVITQNTQH